MLEEMRQATHLLVGLLAIPYMYTVYDRLVISLLTVV